MYTKWFHWCTKLIRNDQLGNVSEEFVDQWMCWMNHLNIKKAAISYGVGKFGNRSFGL